MFLSKCNGLSEKVVGCRRLTSLSVIDEPPSFSWNQTLFHDSGCVNLCHDPSWESEDCGPTMDVYLEDLGGTVVFSWTLGPIYLRTRTDVVVTG